MEPIITDWTKKTVMDCMADDTAAKWWEENMLTGPDESEYGWFEDAQAFHKTNIIGTWNALVRVKVSGSDAAEVLQGLITNSFANFKVGCVKHALLCNENGKIVVNGIFIHDEPDTYIFTGGPHALWVKYQVEKAAAAGKNVTSELINECSWSISGPTALYACEEACGESLRDLAFMHSKFVTVDGIRCRIIRQSMTAEIGYEFQAPMEYDEQLGRAITATGKKYGGVQYGGKGGLTQESESGFQQVMTDMLPAVCSQSPEDIEFRQYMEQFAPGMFEFMMKRKGSYEFNDPSALYKSPIEMGEGFMVKFDHDFIGRAALEAEHANPKRVARKLVWNSEDVIDIYASMFQRERQPYPQLDMPHFPVSYMYADKVINREGNVVGWTSRNMYSPWYREYFCEACIDVEYAELGTELTVVYGDPHGPQKYVRATVAPMRYKEDHRRDDVTAMPASIEPLRYEDWK